MPTFAYQAVNGAGKRLRGLEDAASPGRAFAGARGARPPGARGGRVERRRRPRRRLQVRAAARGARGHARDGRAAPRGDAAGAGAQRRVGRHQRRGARRARSGARTRRARRDALDRARRVPGALLAALCRPRARRRAKRRRGQRLRAPLRPARTRRGIARTHRLGGHLPAPPRVRRHRGGHGAALLRAAALRHAARRERRDAARFDPPDALGLDGAASLLADPLPRAARDRRLRCVGAQHGGRAGARSRPGSSPSRS